MFFLLKVCCAHVASLGNCSPAYSSLNTHSAVVWDAEPCGPREGSLASGGFIPGLCSVSAEQSWLPAAGEPALGANQESSLGEVNELFVALSDMA